VDLTCAANTSSAYTFRLTIHPANLNAPETPSTYAPSAFSSVQYLGSRDPATNVAACQSWYSSDPGPPRDVLPCPALLSQIQADQFFVETEIDPTNPGAEHYYRQRISSSSGGGQQCNYKNGEILNSVQGGGTVGASSPVALRGLVQHSLQVLFYDNS